MAPSTDADVIIIGAGPAGMFCADRLADLGQRVLMLDAGRPMAKRWCPETKICACKSCYVLEGEGGAGGFSDGKLPYSLMRGTQLEQIFDASCEDYLRQIDDVVVDLAGPGVWYDAAAADVQSPFPDLPTTMEFGTYPLRHVGSDGVRRWSSGMTDRLAQKNVKIEYGRRVERVVGVDGSAAPHVVVSSESGIYAIYASKIIIATGIEGIPWSEQILKGLGVPLMSGPAGIGLRVETPAEDMAPLFDAFYDWKIVYKPLGSSLVLRSFCCNQNGAIVNQYHQRMGIRGVNGHASLDPRERTQSSNFAMIAKISTDFCDDPPEYVRSVARAINALSGGHTARQLGWHFLGAGSLRPRAEALSFGTNMVMARWANIPSAMPEVLMALFSEFIESIVWAVPSMSPDRMLIYGPELKYPARRVPVDFRTWQVRGLENLYVIGDATGYLDSFVAAAVSGLAAAERMMEVSMVRS